MVNQQHGLAGALECPPTNATTAQTWARLRPEAAGLLGHPRRHAIREILTASPGATFLEIARRLGTAVGVTAYHLQRLERYGVVLSVRSGRARRYYLVGQDGAPFAYRHAACHSGTVALRVLELVTNRSGITQRDIHLALGLPASRQAVDYHINRLAHAGVLIKERIAGTFAIRVTHRQAEGKPDSGGRGEPPRGAPPQDFAPSAENPDVLA